MNWKLCCCLTLVTCYGVYAAGAVHADLINGHEINGQLIAGMQVGPPPGLGGPFEGPERTAVVRNEPYQGPRPSQKSGKRWQTARTSDRQLLQRLRAISKEERFVSRDWGGMEHSSFFEQGATVPPQTFTHNRRFLPLSSIQSHTNILFSPQM